MTSAAKKLLEAALALPEDDRRRVAQRLLESVSREALEDVERAWDEEVLRRIEAARGEHAPARAWDEASAELRAKYAGK